MTDRPQLQIHARHQQPARPVYRSVYRCHWTGWLTGRINDRGPDEMALVSPGGRDLLCVPAPQGPGCVSASATIYAH